MEGWVDLGYPAMQWGMCAGQMYAGQLRENFRLLTYLLQTVYIDVHVSVCLYVCVYMSLSVCICIGVEFRWSCRVRGVSSMCCWHDNLVWKISDFILDVWVWLAQPQVWSLWCKSQSALAISYWLRCLWTRRKMNIFRRSRIAVVIAAFVMGR